MSRIQSKLKATCPTKHDKGRWGGGAKKKTKSLSMHIAYTAKICLLQFTKSQSFVKNITWFHSLHQSHGKRLKRAENAPKPNAHTTIRSEHARRIAPSPTTVLKKDTGSPSYKTTQSADLRYIKLGAVRLTAC